MLQPEEEETSDSSDEDYIPQDVEVSEEEESGEEENDQNQDQETGDKLKKKSTKKKVVRTKDAQRKRKGGIKLEGEDPVEEQAEEERDLDKEIAEELEEKKEEKEKKRIDDLWADFMKDVEPPGRVKANTVGSEKVQSTSVSAYSCPTAKKPEKVTVTKIFDFAGETVKITKEVEAGSKEAKSVDDKTEEPTSSTVKPVSTGVKRTAGGLGNVLGMIGKKAKISTLDKSKLDWEKFKEKEGISEELKIHNRGKDGFIERKNFLERTDLRQFEVEKNIRLANSKR